MKFSRSNLSEESQVNNVNALRANTENPRKVFKGFIPNIYIKNGRGS